MLGVNSEQKESYATLCIPDSIYGLTLAWVTSENSTKQLECRHLLTQSSSLDPILSATVSGVDRICPWFHANSLCCPSPTAYQLLSPTNSLSCPLTTSGYGEISGPKSFVCFGAKPDKGIVCLAGHLYSVTQCQTVLFDLWIGLFQVLLLQVREPVSNENEGYSTFP